MFLFLFVVRPRLGDRNVISSEVLRVSSRLVAVRYLKERETRILLFFIIKNYLKVECRHIIIKQQTTLL